MEPAKELDYSVYTNSSQNVRLRFDEIRKKSKTGIILPKAQNLKFIKRGSHSAHILFSNIWNLTCGAVGLSGSNQVYKRCWATILQNVEKMWARDDFL